MAFPTDVPAAAVGTPVAGDTAARFALTQTVETLPLQQSTIISRTNLADGSEVMLVEVRKRFTRAVAGTGAWLEVAL
jgi:hypothetical protein